MHTHRARTPITILVLMILLVLAACGDNSSIVPPPGGDQTTTTAPGTETTSPPQETTTTAPPGDEPAPTTEPTPSAADMLADFFAAAEALDAQIVNAANTFNAGFDEGAMTLSAQGVAAVNALDAGPVADLIPAGLLSNLDRAVLAVYADLDSRIAAMQSSATHMTASEHDYVMDCLLIGGTSFYRFDDDLAQAKDMAALAPPVTPAAPDSEAAGILAVRIAAIHSMNFGCDSCGGVQYDSPIPVDWPGRTVADGVGFDANFVGGAWDIVIWAC